MLGRLFRHEMKHAAPIFLLLYGIFLAVTALARIGMELMERYEVLNIPSMLLFIGYIVGIMAVLLFPGFYAVIRFYRNLTGAQGYLMFTLPVRTSAHVWAKLLSAMLWELASVIVFLVSLLEMAVGGAVMEDIKKMLTFLPEMMRGFGNADGVIFLAELLLLMLLTSASRLLLFYASIAIGQCLVRHRVLGAVGGYLGLSFITQSILYTLLTVFAAMGGNSYFLQQILGGIGTSSAFFAANSSLNLLLLIYLLVILLFASAYYLVTVLLLGRKLNLA